LRYIRGYRRYHKIQRRDGDGMGWDGMEMGEGDWGIGIEDEGVE
jgi:hypothetical protein